MIADVARSISIHERTLGKVVEKAKDSDRVQGKDLPETEWAEWERLGPLRTESPVLRMEHDCLKKWRPRS